MVCELGKGSSAEPYIVSGYETLAQRDYAEQLLQKSAYSPLGTAVGTNFDLDPSGTGDRPEKSLPVVRRGHQRQATDPVYRGAEFFAQYYKTGSMQLPDGYASDMVGDGAIPRQKISADMGQYMKNQGMEYQYGAFEQFADYIKTATQREDEDEEML